MFVEPASKPVQGRLKAAPNLGQCRLYLSRLIKPKPRRISRANVGRVPIAPPQVPRLIVAQGPPRRAEAAPASQCAVLERGAVRASLTGLHPLLEDVLRDSRRIQDPPKVPPPPLLQFPKMVAQLPMRRPKLNNSPMRRAGRLLPRSIRGQRPLLRPPRPRHGLRLHRPLSEGLGIRPGSFTPFFAVQASHASHFPSTVFRSTPKAI